MSKEQEGKRVTLKLVEKVVMAERCARIAFVKFRATNNTKSFWQSFFLKTSDTDLKRYFDELQGSIKDEKALEELTKLLLGRGEIIDDSQ